MGTNLQRKKAINGLAQGYSQSENKIFSLLPKNGAKISSLELAEQFYNNDIPFNGRKIIIGLLTSLQRKAVTNREAFRIMKTQRAGPKAMSFWIQRSR